MEQPHWSAGVHAPPVAFESEEDALYVAMETSGSSNEDCFQPAVVEVFSSSDESLSAESEGSKPNAESVTDEGEVLQSTEEEGEDFTPKGRYFLGRDGGQRCFACNQAGHVSRDCPARASLPCVLCGAVGHLRDACPEEMCHNCLGAGHVWRTCPEPRRRRAAPTDECAGCGLRGHLRRECSMIWRRYRLTVALEGPGAFTNAELSRALRAISRSCYYCAAPTHFGDECPQRFDAADRTAFCRPEMHFLALASGAESLGHIHPAGQSEAPRRVSHFGKRGGSQAGRPRSHQAMRDHERALGHSQAAHLDYAPRRGRGGAQRGAYRHVSYRPSDR